MTIVFLVYVILYYALTLYAMNSNYQQHACKWIMGYPNIIRIYKNYFRGFWWWLALKKNNISS